MAALTEEQKREIVVAFAQCKQPYEIRDLFKAEHDVELDIRHIVQYDPKRASFNVGAHWREIYEIEHKAFLEDAKSVPAFNQGYRLQMLQKHIARADKAGNSVLVSQLLEQAAKESGGLLTNARNLTVDDKRKGVHELSVEERRAAAVDLLREAFQKKLEETSGVVIDQPPSE